ncbi:hypothetical protein FV232_02935 [Methylobacterium sp. WL30]|uniref:hypothetical protein n=1 Tax=unclassified Methylobacterium TaxID=2615210 RepID=UPI0011CB6324|nr:MULTISPECIES: hypothetical protein [unclassified Methylobacterium]TXN33420.1 hypothetical protein FV225_18850 [Methylobacterium sp. WL93]TXN51802.1 hypothetical protein FV227_06605 [Methylobacterium sp. WL119]TXN70288.1 hypothetical protein FV232_02935 [Methylobacterium sp. WL30]
MATGKFDGAGFFAALDAERAGRRATWKKVAEQSGVPASSLTRMSQGRRPDVDTLSALCGWSGLRADDFFRIEGGERPSLEPLAQITVHLRADPKLSSEGAKALEVLIKTAYQQLRIK